MLSYLKKILFFVFVLGFIRMIMQDILSVHVLVFLGLRVLQKEWKIKGDSLV